MTVTTELAGLDGPNEPFSDTVRNLLASAWNPADHPGTKAMFISEGGTDTGSAALTKNDIAILRKRKGAVACQCRDGETVINQQANSFTWSARVVYIDIFAPDYRASELKRLIEVRDFVDDVILRHPTGPYPKASDNRNSAIAGFQDYGVAWQPPAAADPELKTSEQLSGELLCEFKRSVVPSTQ